MSYIDIHYSREAGMEPEAKDKLDRFFSDDRYNTRLSMAARFVGVDNKDVTNWRQRGLLIFPPHKIGGRQYTNRDGMLTLGVMAELSWLIGPENASAASQAIWETFLARWPHGLDFEQFRDTVVYFRKPIVSFVDVSDKPRIVNNAGDDFERFAGFPMRVATASDLSVQPVPNGTTVIFPVGSLFCQWALRAQAQLEDA